MADREVATKWMAGEHQAICREILRCEVGSTSHGVSLSGQDDFDMMAIAIPHPEYMLGLTGFETDVVRTAEIREQKKSVRSQPGDFDLSIHSLKKFCNLAGLKGNPSVMLMLYAPIMAADEIGLELRAQRHLFSSKAVGRAFLGYMIAQKERLLGERGQMRTTREELIKEHGFDTKYAYHVLRLGYQGMRFLETGEIECPLNDPTKEYLLDVRRGLVSFEEIVGGTEYYQEAIKNRLVTSDMRDTVDVDAINRMMIRMHQQAWGYYESC